MYVCLHHSSVVLNKLPHFHPFVLILFPMYLKTIIPSNMRKYVLRHKNIISLFAWNRLRNKAKNVRKCKGESLYDFDTEYAHFFTNIKRIKILIHQFFKKLHLYVCACRLYHKITQGNVASLHNRSPLAALKQKKIHCLSALSKQAYYSSSGN